MEYIDLLDDSDDDILLIPSNKPTPFTAASTSHKGDLSINLISSDDDDGLDLPQFKCDVKTLPELGNQDDSDQTEVYSNSDLSSLPDIQMDEINDSENVVNRASEISKVDSQTKPYSSLMQLSQDDANSCQHVERNKPPKKSDSQSNEKSSASTKNNKALERKRAREEKRLEKEKKKQEKEREKQLKIEEKQQLVLEKKRKAALQAAEREAKRAQKPGECHRHMMIEVDEELKSSVIGVQLEAVCLSNGVSMRYIRPKISNSVLFLRKSIDPQTSDVSYDTEDNIAVILNMTDLVSIIAGDSPVLLHDYIQSVSAAQNTHPTILVFGCEKYFRDLKTQKNRVYRDQVLQTQKNSRKNKALVTISRADYEQALTSVQISTNTVFIHEELEENIAKTIMRMNKAIAEAPVKRRMYEQQALSVRAAGLTIGKDNQGARNVWQRMLQESRNISSDVASAIVTKYPSPLLLYRAYERSLNATDAELLLQDIEVRRGGGVVETRRRVGREVSRRVYQLVMSNDPLFVIK